MFEILAVGVGVAAAAFALVRFTPIWGVIHQTPVTAAAANDSRADDDHA